jgi:alpha,alpha-trehalase
MNGQKAAAALALLLLIGRAGADPAPPLPAIRDYIRAGWKSLTRTHRDLLKAAADPKMPPPANGRYPIYVARDVDPQAITAALARELPPRDLEKLEVRRLPADPSTITEHGLLYLPHPYVVPGGRFNEMYGWDSYFIVLGLLDDGEVELARNMVDNHIYEVEHYGAVLNANRTYYLTRSQPPFLSGMVLAVYRATHNRDWLAAALPALEKYHRFWTSPPHLTSETGLSRYMDRGVGPAPEVLKGEKDAQGQTHYDRVRAYFRARAQSGESHGRAYDAAHDRLTDTFFVADRSMRESGFDPTNRFGPFGSEILDLNPVCLNSLLFRMEEEMAQIAQALGRADDAAPWRARAEQRRERMNRLLWDEAAGLYFDYDFVAKRRHPYPFATTFLPLWAGIATPHQAARVVKNLPLFERAGGLQTSPTVTGNQWDAPYGWAPLELFAVRGLQRYGHHAEADRIARKFASLIARQFAERGAIYEKYDVVSRKSRVDVKFGYTTNEIGFGWTNAAYLELAEKREQP